MRKYETVCIVKPDVGEETIKSAIQKATGALEAGGGRLEKLDEWGRRRLAYTIQKKSEGYYFVLYYETEPHVSKEIERVLKLNENVLRYQTIVRIERKTVAESAKALAQPAPAEGGAHGNG